MQWQKNGLYEWELVSRKVLVCSAQSTPKLVIKVEQIVSLCAHLSPEEQNRSSIVSVPSIMSNVLCVNHLLLQKCLK